MRESRSSGSVGERGGNDPLYPDFQEIFFICKTQKKYGNRIIYICAVQVREVGIYRQTINNNETPLSLSAGNQSCPARANHPPEASLA